MSGDIFCLNWGKWGVGESASDIPWVEARDAAEYPTTHRTDAHNKGLSDQNVNSAEVEKPWSRWSLRLHPLPALTLGDSVVW